MLKRIREVVFEKDQETGKVLSKRTICVEAEDDVPVGCEMGCPKPWEYLSFREKLAVFRGDRTLVVLFIATLADFCILSICGIIWFIK